MAQTMNNCQAPLVPFNQNLFYQNSVPNVYAAPTPQQLTVHGIQSNVNQQSGIQPNQVQQSYQSNEEHGEENVYHQL